MTGPTPSPATTRRRVRRVDVWSVFKVSVLFFFVCGIIWLAALLIVWNVINAFGWVSQLEGLAGKLVGGSFRLDSGTLLWAALLIDLITVAGFTIAATLLALLYNLISDVVGGVTVTADEIVARRDRRLLGGISLPFRRPRRKPAVEGIGAGRPPGAAAATATGRGSPSPKPAPAGQPRRPPTGGGAVTVKRAPQPTRSGAGGSAKTPGEGAAKPAPKAKPAAVGAEGSRPAPKDGPSVAPVPPKASVESAAQAKTEGKR